MAIFRELSLCCWSAGKSCPRSVPSVTSTSGATEFLVFNPEWIFNYECQLVHETCRINFTDACYRHKWLCIGPFEAKHCVKMSRPLRWNDTYGIFFMYRLCSAQTIWMDGTFKAAPSLFTQIYTVHVELHGQFFPVLMALLPDKQEATYSRLFQVLCNKAAAQQLLFQPQAVHCDYEMAVLNAVAAVLGVQATGCLFHFDQSI